MATDQAAAHHEDHPVGWKRYVYLTNHKDIGTMYLICDYCGIGGASVCDHADELQALRRHFGR